MQMDEEVGKVSSPVPVMVSRALERFLEYIMTSTAEVTTSKDAKTLTSQHILEVVTNDSRLSFLKDVTLKSCSLVSSNNGTLLSGLSE
jgi:hypothetical protein